jgi:hypothetical protein
MTDGIAIALFFGVLLAFLSLPGVIFLVTHIR